MKTHLRLIGAAILLTVAGLALAQTDSQTMDENTPMHGGMSDATAAYMAAMSKMDAPMMQGVQASDPDVAFVKGMIPHHQGAIDMAKVELQFGDDETVKAWANQIIAAQEKEIAEMQEWLKAHGE